MQEICRTLNGKDGSEDIQPVLDKLEEPIRKILPPSYAKKPSLLRALRSYLGKCRDSYRPRDLLKCLLKHVEAEWSEVNPDFALSAPPCPRPEYLLALAPLPQVHQALIGVLAESYSLDQLLLEESLSAPFLFGFCANASLPGGPLPPFRNSSCGILREEVKKKRCFLIFKPDSSLDWEMVECRRDSLKLSVFARATVSRRGPPIPSPELQKFIPSWYGVAFGRVEQLVGGCSDAFTEDRPFFAKTGGYDWDLVMEYHNDLLENLRRRSATVRPAVNPGM